MWTGVWKVDKILAYRWNENGFEFLVRWAGCKRKGKPWEDSWERELSDDLKEHYFKSIELKESRMCRAHVHCLTIEALTLRGLASTAYEVYGTVLQVGDI
ncbi:hypothetical protein AB1Y20_020375 [Prymnesium parvum]|uniref:Chromo domain-containing protein n=1 Tax=Prymnesium parvum TaxID=97485 RepID=A0AB34JZ41_PRYPA